MQAVKKRLVLMTVMLIIWQLLSGCGSDREPGKEVTENSGSPNEEKEFVIAGSGSNLPIMRKLITAYRQKHPEINIVLPESIGSGGAIKGIKEGGLELGLISRDLKEEEKAAGIKVLPYGKVGLVLGVHPGVSDENLSYQEYVDIIKGKKNKWQDGNDIVVFTREVGDSTIDMLVRFIPGFKEAHEEAIKSERWQIPHSDSEMDQKIINTPYAIGYSDTGSITTDKLAIKMLKINNVAPTPENISSGKYEMIKVNSIIYKEPVSRRAQDFLDFVFSVEGQKIQEQNGYVPIK